MQREGFKRQLCERGWLSGQPPKLQQCILERASIRNMRDGEFLYAIGDPPRGLYALLDGVVKLSFDTPQGKELLLKVFKPGEWFGVVGLIDKEPMPHHARVSGFATILTVSADDFNAIVHDQPASLKNFALIMADNMRHSMERLVDVSVLTPAQRLAKLLLNVGLSPDNNSTQCTGIELSQFEISSMASTSRATVNKLLREWEAQGVLEHRYKKLRILDPESLRALVDG